MTDDVEINRLKDESNITETEKKHVPVIGAPNIMAVGGTFEVNVSIGRVAHIMEEEHYIEWIELWFLDRKVGKVELKSSDEKAEAVFTVKVPEDTLAAKEYQVCHIRGVNVCGDEGVKSVTVNLEALASCNVHGLWENAKLVEIVSKEAGKETI
ncbi:MAG: class II SORL domain-containing protein [Euryarchaeota archaeon]|nr:class II SORL domain-containing protein [Euryarchaeota archaeon]